MGSGDGLDVGVDLACDEAFEAADGVAFRVSFGDASLEVGDGRRAAVLGPHPNRMGRDAEPPRTP